MRAFCLSLLLTFFVSTAPLHAQPPPAIATGPVDQHAAAGDSVAFTVAASGDNLTYRWSRADTPLPGATTATLVLRNLTAADVGRYTVTVANAAGTASASADLLLDAAGQSPLDPTFAPAVKAAINVVAGQPDGKILIGGAFDLSLATRLNTRGIARLNVDGSYDTGFTLAASLGSSGRVSAILVQPDGRILVGGEFTTIGGGNRNHLARLFPDGSLDPTFDAYLPASGGSDFDPRLTQLALANDGRIAWVAGGGRLRCLLPDGSPDPDFTVSGLDPLGPASYSRIAWDALGRILVSVTEGATGSSTIFRLRRDGSRDTSFPFVRALTFPSTIATSEHVNQLAVQADGGILVAVSGPPSGLFSTGKLLRLKDDGSVDAAFKPLTASTKYDADSAPVFTLAPDGRIFVVTAPLVGPYGEATVYRLGADGSVDATYKVRVNGKVASLVLDPARRLVLGGNFSTVADTTRPGLARLVPEPTGWPYTPQVVAISPASQTVNRGDGVRVHVEAVGTGALSYRWLMNSAAMRLFENNTGLPNGGAILEDGGATLYLPAASGRYQGQIQVQVSNRSGTVTSPPVSLSVRDANPYLVVEPAAVATAPGRDIILAASALATEPVTYAWFKDGRPLGVTDFVLRLNAITSASAGTYTCTISNAQGPLASEQAVVQVADGAQLINLSTRAAIGPAAGNLIVGFVVAGPQAKLLLLRGIGPSLGQFISADLSAAPVMRLYQGDGTLLREVRNNQPGASFIAPGGAFPLLPGSSEPALSTTLTPGSYTLEINGSPGLTLAEIYENDRNPSRLTNLSARAYVGTGSSLAIPGFVVAGNAPRRFLLRAAGPGLAQFNVPGALADPVLTVMDHDGIAIATNDDWAPALAGDFARVGAFGFAADSKDAALVLELPPGSYTALATGKNEGTGVVLVEMYELP